MKDLKVIFHLVKPYWKRVALAGIISILISGLSASLAWLVKPALDDIFIKKDITLLILLPIGILLIFTAKGTFNLFNEYLMRSASQKMLMDLRNRLYDHIIKLPLGFFSRHSSGSLISKTITDAHEIERLVSLTLKDLFIEGATIMALTGVALWRRWDLALIAIIVLPGAFQGAVKLGQKLKRISKRRQEKIAKLTEILNESFGGVKIIKSFTMETEESGRFKKVNKDFYREHMRTVRTAEFTSLMMEFAAGLGIAFVIWYGGKLIIDDTITIGSFFSFLTAIFMIYTPAKRLAKVNNGVQQARAPLQRIMGILSEGQEVGGKNEIKVFQKDILYKDVSFTYPSSKKEALSSINITINKDEVIAIVGKSGSGKTTLINMLPRFYSPDKGHIYIDSTDISILTFRSLRSLFGIVSQDVVLFNDTITANIKYGSPNASSGDVVEAAKAAHADEFIMNFPIGYDTVIGERGLKLSGGQRQRLSIARAVLKNPPILILDEATSSLDTSSEMLIQKALEKLMTHKTTLVIAHRLSTIRKADRIFVMEKGKVIEAGTHKELLDQGGVYKELYELQFRGQEVNN